MSVMIRDVGESRQEMKLSWLRGQKQPVPAARWDCGYWPGCVGDTVGTCQGMLSIFPLRPALSSLLNMVNAKLGSSEFPLDHKLPKGLMSSLLSV